MKVIHWTALVAVLLLGSRALAADQPQMAPTRPVTVTYRLSGNSHGNGPGKIEVTYDQDAKRVRMDFYRFEGSSDPMGTVIFDKTLDRVVTLIDARKAYLQRDTAGLANPGVFLGPTLTYTREGTEHFAGLTCTDWAVKKGNENGSACVTDDGVVLKASRGGSNAGQIEAVAITYGPPPASAFAIPQGYTRLQPAAKPPVR